MKNNKKTFLNDVNLISSAGNDINSLWDALLNKKSHLQNSCTKNWKKSVLEYFESIETTPKANYIESEKTKSYNKKIVKLLSEIFNLKRPNFRNEKNLGVIFASTKGATEDFIWKENEKIQSLQDPYQDILDNFIRKENLSPIHSLTLSNACASVHSAICLGKTWIESEICDDVLIIAADLIGPFTLSGFHTLRSIAKDKQSPFSKDRDGLHLGEAAGFIWLSNTPSKSKNSLKVISAHLINEGEAVTRPSANSHGLKTILEKAKADLKDETPDIFLAHGTATKLNDTAEDLAFSEVFEPDDFKVTATKGVTGHCLGASGLIDVAAIYKIFESKKVFSIANTSKLDPSLRCNYLIDKNLKFVGNKILSSSLGFGGINSVIVIGEENELC